MLLHESLNLIHGICAYCLGDPELAEPVIIYQLREVQSQEPADFEEAARRLTPMQTQVLRLLLRCRQYKEIARYLGNSANIVHHHVSDILRRLASSDRIELLAKFQVRAESKELLSVPSLSQARLIEDSPQTPKERSSPGRKIRVRGLVAS